jgi:hypothetical protein
MRARVWAQLRYPFGVVRVVGVRLVLPVRRFGKNLTSSRIILRNSHSSHYSHECLGNERHRLFATPPCDQAKAVPLCALVESNLLDSILAKPSVT